MATVAGSTIDRSAAKSDLQSLAGFADRWIYVFMASLFIVTVLVGFIPDSLKQISAIAAGQRPPYPRVLHVHAVLMSAWLLLLLAQTFLAATRRISFHKQLGMASVVLAPLMVITGIVLVPTMFHQNWAGMQNPPPGVDLGGIEIAKKFLSSLVAAQLAVGVMFAVFVTWALAVRKTDSGMHKRLMILATVLPLPAAIDRIGWIPSSYPTSFLSPALYTVLWITPMILWDVVRHRHLHRAYVVWFAIYLPVATLVVNLWWSSWWIEIVQRMMGVNG
jgi:hypothetical protein